MKKVKIMLTAITVFAVVGGALAFKAAKTPASIFVSGGNPDVCNVPANVLTTESGIATPYNTQAINTPCPLVTSTTSQEF